MALLGAIVLLALYRMTRGGAGPSGADARGMHPDVTKAIEAYTAESLRVCASWRRRANMAT